MLAIGSLAILSVLIDAKDKVPDLLRQTCGTYFERDGFCFAIVPAASEGQGRLDVYFQNRYASLAAARLSSSRLSSSC